MNVTLIKTRKYLRDKPVEKYIPSPQAMESINKSFDIKGEKLMANCFYTLIKAKFNNTISFNKRHIIK
jgi:hypothetical protein